MRLIKWVLFFIFSFAVSWILIITFSQAAFKTPTPMRMFTYTTPAFPVYYYIAGAFTAGLIIGLLIAGYYFIMLNARIHKKEKSIRELETEIADLQTKYEMPKVTPASSGTVTMPDEER
jgi:uncharacterized membrane protein YciS (DUF1049 family)